MVLLCIMIYNLYLTSIIFKIKKYLIKWIIQKKKKKAITLWYSKYIIIKLHFLWGHSANI